MMCWRLKLDWFWVLKGGWRILLWSYEGFRTALALYRCMLCRRDWQPAAVRNAPYRCNALQRRAPSWILIAYVWHGPRNLLRIFIFIHPTLSPSVSRWSCTCVDLVDYGVSYKRVLSTTHVQDVQSLAYSMGAEHSTQFSVGALIYLARSYWPSITALVIGFVSGNTNNFGPRLC